MQRFRQTTPVILPLILFSVAIWAISQELRHYSLQVMLQHWATLSSSRKFGAIALTGLGYFMMTGYDLLGFRYIRQSLALSKIALTAFISYAVGNTVGFSAFSGTAIRYRFYRGWNIPSTDIAKLVIFTHIIFWLGLFSVSGCAFILDPLTLPKVLHLPLTSVHPLGVFFLSLAIIYFMVGLFWRKPWHIGQETIFFPSIPISLASIILAALDWGIASGVLYLLLPDHSAISYLGFFGIYLVALTAGLISSVPGGLGVFETVILWLRPSDLPASEVLGALIAYRGIYFLLPLLVALCLLLILLWSKRRI